MGYVEWDRGEGGMGKLGAGRWEDGWAGWNGFTGIREGLVELLVGLGWGTRF